MPGGVELRGGDQLLAGLDAARAELADTSAADSAAGELLADRVRARAPKRTGYLASTIGYQLLTAGAELVVAAPYAAAVEARRPFAHNTVEAALPDVVTIYTEHAEQALDQLKGA
jgi:hypothetical protein